MIALPHARIMLIQMAYLTVLGHDKTTKMFICLSIVASLTIAEKDSKPHTNMTCLTHWEATISPAVRIVVIFASCMNIRTWKRRKVSLAGWMTLTLIRMVQIGLQAPRINGASCRRFLCGSTGLPHVRGDQACQGA